MGHISAAYCAHTSNTSNSTNKHSLSQDGSSDRRRQEMGHLSSILCSQATHLTAQTNTAYHKIGHLIGAAIRWDISAAYCTHTSNTANSTNKHSLSQDGSSDRSRQEMGHLSSILCRNTSNSTNKHSLSQDGSSDRSRQRWDISVLTQATHLTAQTNTAYHKMGNLIGAAKRWDISAAYCAHTSNTSNSTNKHSLSQDGSSDRSRQEMGHLSSILCSHKQQHKQTQPITRWVI